MKKWHKVIIFSCVLILVVGLILINVIQTTTNNANEAIAEIEADEEVNENLYIDSKQVFEVLEQAHDEQRELSLEEKQLVNEFDTKYNSDTNELTHAEAMVVNQLILMSYEVVPSSQLESEKNRYEEYKDSLLEYVEF